MGCRWRQTVKNTSPYKTLSPWAIRPLLSLLHLVMDVLGGARTVFMITNRDYLGKDKGLLLRPVLGHPMDLGDVPMRLRHPLSNRGMDNRTPM